MSPTNRMDVRRRGRSFTALAAIALIVAAQGCDDPLEPEALAGWYVLDSVDGEPLPAVLIDNGYYRFHVHADQLRLRSDRTGHRVTTGVSEDLSGGQPSEATRWEADLAFRVVGQRIEIELVCPPNALALCTAPPHLIAHRTPTGLRVEDAQVERLPLVYVRAPGW